MREQWIRECGCGSQLVEWVDECDGHKSEPSFCHGWHCVACMKKRYKYS